MKVNKIDMSCDFKYVELHPIGDLHFGDKLCDVKLFKEKIDHIKNTPNAIAFINGDMCDNATRDSIGDSYSATCTPIDQAKSVADMLMPIRDKIVAINTGTHEMRTIKKSGVDLTELIAMQLGIEDKYSDTASLVFVRFGSIRSGKRQRCFSIYGLHGARGGRSIGSKANALEGVGNIMPADIILHNHTHDLIAFKKPKYFIDYHNSGYYERDICFVNSPAYLKYGGYAEYGEYLPASKSQPVIYVYDNLDSIEVRI